MSSALLLLLEKLLGWFGRGFETSGESIINAFFSTTTRKRIVSYANEGEEGRREREKETATPLRVGKLSLMINVQPSRAGEDGGGDDWED